MSTYEEREEIEAQREETCDSAFAVGLKLILLIIACSGAVWLTLACLGCTKTALKRIVVDPNTGIVSYTAFTNYECMMKSSMKDAEVVIEDKQGYRHYAIGSRDQAPDPNTVKAVGDYGGVFVEKIVPGGVL